MEARINLGSQAQRPWTDAGQCQISFKKVQQLNWKDRLDLRSLRTEMPQQSVRQIIAGWRNREQSAWVGMFFEEGQLRAACLLEQIPTQGRGQGNRIISQDHLFANSNEPTRSHMLGVMVEEAARLGAAPTWSNWLRDSWDRMVAKGKRTKRSPQTEQVSRS